VIHIGSKKVIRVIVDSYNNTASLLAYPRSGSNWFRYCFEFITKRHTVSRNELWETEAKPPNMLYHAHYTHERGLDDHVVPKKIILLLKNHKEAILSTMRNNQGRDLTDTESIQLLSNTIRKFKDPNATSSPPSGGYPRKKIKDYCELLALYDAYATKLPTDCLLVYYEDFIREPYSVLSNLIDYLSDNFAQAHAPGPASRRLQEDLGEVGVVCRTTYLPGDEMLIPSHEEMQHNLNQLLDTKPLPHPTLQDAPTRFQYHRNCCLQNYRGTGGMAQSSTKDSTDLCHYSKQFENEILMILDRITEDTCRNLSDNLFDKYLSHYKEKDDQ